MPLSWNEIRDGYGKKDFRSDADRVAFLFELYQQYTSLLPADGKKAKRPRARAMP